MKTLGLSQIRSLALTISVFGIFFAALFLLFNMRADASLGGDITCGVLGALNDTGSPIPSLGDGSCGSSAPQDPGDDDDNGDAGEGDSGDTDTGGGTTDENPGDDAPTAPTGSSTIGSGPSGVPAESSGPAALEELIATTTDLGGEILGTSTVAEVVEEEESAPPEPACGPYLNTYLRMGRQNDPAEVEKLQTFLNDHMGEELPVTGYFGVLTDQAVRAFQLHYAEEILTPWVPHGLQSEHAATGYVYKTTKRKIDNLMCDSLNLPIPSLP